MKGILKEVARLGDQWEIPKGHSSFQNEKLLLDAGWDMLFPSEEKILLEIPAGTAIQVFYSPEHHALTGKDLSKIVPSKEEKRWYLRLISFDPLRFQWIAQEEKEELPLEKITTERGVEVTFSPEDQNLIYQTPVSSNHFELSRQASFFAASHGFDKLISLPLLRNMEIYEYQLKTVQTVLQRFRGRALLCDEVGLGKTIEACMILLELLARKLAQRILILTPPSLVEQWQGELSHKFGLDFVSYDRMDFKEAGEQAWTAFHRIVASYHTAKREPHRTAISEQSWDLVILDEAHHLRNKKTLLWKFASSLKKKYILLLTATPLQNDLEELYNLVTLLQPGLLSTFQGFKKQFINPKDKLNPRNLDGLHSLLSEAMVRNRRSTVDLQFTRRYAQTFRIAPSSFDQNFYKEISQFVRERLKSKIYSRMALISLQKALGSSNTAAGCTLKHMAGSEKISPKDTKFLLEMAQKVDSERSSAKVKKLMEILSNFPDKIVIFTQFRSTQDFLYQILSDSGNTVALFHGGLNRIQKEKAIRSFQKEARILLSTESGSEGRNLQFCHGLCNFDLPWNPMRIEQRIGRLSRIGQKEDVHIFNLVHARTIEDEVVSLLEAKLNLFELVVGEMDMILGNLEEEEEFEEMVLNLWIEAEDDSLFHQHMERLGTRLVVAKEEYLRQQKLDDKIFGDKFTPGKIK